MKKTFLAPKLLQLGLILSSTFCSQIHMYGAENNTAGSTGTQHSLPKAGAASPQQLQNDTVEPKKDPKDLRIISGDGLAQNDSATAIEGNTDLQKTVLINFNNISIIEYIRFISRIINKNFVFDENDLQFNVTIISEEPATLENIMTALLQELRIHDLTLLEQGNNLLIHKNPKVNAISQLVSEETPLASPNSEIITQVFRLNTAVPEQVASVIKPLTSEFALVEILPRTNHLIITDLSTNVLQIAKLIKSVDSPASGLVIGQYVVKTTSPDVLIEMARQILTPIAQDQPLTMVPWEGSTSIFIVSTPYLVERTLLLLQHIDQNERSTKILDLIDVRQRTPLIPQIPTLPESPEERAYRLSRTSHPEGIPPEAHLPIEGETREGIEAREARERALRDERARREAAFPGKWFRDSNGNWVFPLANPAGELTPEGVPTQPLKGTRTKIPAGRWELDKDGNWHFVPGASGENIPGQGFGVGPAGHWAIDPVTGGWQYVLDKNETIEVKKFSRPNPQSVDIPLGAKQKTYFALYKLQFRKGDTIRNALQAIASSLNPTEPNLEGIVSTLTSVQWLETSNSLIFTGYQEDLLKMRELMAEVDVPLRQVFIEMLILETSLTDSLEYSVTWGSRFANGNWGGGVGHSTDLSAVDGVLAQTGIAAGNVNSAVANQLVNRTGFDLGIVGQKIINTATGIEFNSISALVFALQTKLNTNIILSPKIITEDNVPAEIFVGENVSFKTQSIANQNSTTITNNFEYRDVGTRLRVTPSIGNNDVISIEIAQEISAIIPGTLPTDQNSPGPNTTKSTTTTRVHLPDGYFLIISGMMNDEYDRISSQVPCLGAIPILGAAFKDKFYNDTKTNQMIFLRPKIIDTEEELQNLTKHEQDVWNYKYRRKRDWVEAVEDAFDFLNLKTDLEEVDPDVAGLNS